MIGVIVPAHDEEALIGRCLDALHEAARHPELHGEQVRIVVVLDSCADATRTIAQSHGAACVEVTARNVGVARAAGASTLITAGARWLAFTDADSQVAPDWLARQLDTSADAVCGVVCVSDWTDWGEAARRAYEAGYTDVEDHRHVHGASLGVSSDAYLRAGGFPPLRCSEDVALVSRLGGQGANIRWTNAVRVLTSARRIARAPDGFAAHLASVEQGIRESGDGRAC